MKAFILTFFLVAAVQGSLAAKACRCPNDGIIRLSQLFDVTTVDYSMINLGQLELQDALWFEIRKDWDMSVNPMASTNALKLVFQDPNLSDGESSKYSLSGKNKCAKGKVLEANIDGQKVSFEFRISAQPESLDVDFCSCKSDGDFCENVLEAKAKEHIKFIAECYTDMAACFPKLVAAKKALGIQEVQIQPRAAA